MKENDVQKIFLRNKNFKEIDIATLQYIIQYFQKNRHYLLDGLLKQMPKISVNELKRFESLYELTDQDIKDIKKNSIMKTFSKIGKEHRLGLVISYKRKKELSYLRFLFFTIYTATLARYFRNGGYDYEIMKYVVENTLDNKSDFKKYKSLGVILEKKIAAFVENYSSKELKAYGENVDIPTVDLRTLVVAATSRINSMVKKIAVAYYDACANEDVKLMKRLSREEHKSMEDTSFISVVEYRAIDKLREIDPEILNTAGFNIKSDPNNEAFTKFFLSTYQDNYQLYASIVKDVIKVYTTQNAPVTYSKFRKNFIQMKNSRSINRELLRQAIETHKEKCIEFDITSENKVYKLSILILSYIVLLTYVTGIKIK